MAMKLNVQMSSWVDLYCTHTRLGKSWGHRYEKPVWLGTQDANLYIEEPKLNKFMGRTYMTDYQIAKNKCTWVTWFSNHNVQLGRSHPLFPSTRSDPKSAIVCTYKTWRLPWSKVLVHGRKKPSLRVPSHEWAKPKPKLLKMDSITIPNKMNIKPTASCLQTTSRLDIRVRMTHWCLVRLSPLSPVPQAVNTPPGK